MLIRITCIKEIEELKELKGYSGNLHLSNKLWIP